jgi:molybdate transport system ATP-binding protein
MFEIALAHRLGDFSLDVAFASRSMVTALSGPSGSGKSTTLAAIAGLIRPRSGKLEAGGRVLFDSAARVNVAAHRRGIRMVFQESRLFPHLNVRQNLLFGRWLAGGRQDPEFDRIVELLGIETLLSRRPRKLSGGERQRVALGRALLAKPSALLLDEPLASLDTARKNEILPFLARTVREANVPILYVSHAEDEIAQLAQTIIRIDGGRVTGMETR